MEYIIDKGNLWEASKLLPILPTNRGGRKLIGSLRKKSIPSLFLDVYFGKMFLVCLDPQPFALIFILNCPCEIPQIS